MPKASSWAENTKSLKDEVADVKRFHFDAAPIDDEDGWRVVSAITLSTAFACMAVDVSLSWFEGARMAANIALGVGSVAAVTNIAVSLASENLFAEIEKSHNLPIDSVYANQNTWHADYSNTVSPIAGSSVNDTTINPLIMEDFLYERPFVNLAMLDLHTLDTIQNAGVRAESRFGFILDSLGKLPDSLKKDVDTLLIQGSLLEAERKSVASLNRNCYYLGSDNSVNCAVGLF